MATRNLTKKFNDIRSASKANRHLNRRSLDDVDEYSDSGLLNQAASSTNWKSVKGASLPPRWVEDIERIEDDIATIQLKTRELGGLHQRRLMVNFETDEAQQEQEIEYATQEITEIFRHAEGLLKRFSAQQHGVDDSEAMVRVNIQRSIAKKLQGLSMNFRGTQKDYLNKLKAQKSESGAVFEFENQKAKQTPFDQDMGFTSQQMQMADDMSELVDQRDQEIANIAKSIEELAQIFKELAVLVIDQGTILDRIDFNMESAVEHAKEGIVQLEKAEESQKNALPLRCIILLVFLCTLMLILLIVKHSGK